MFLRASAVLLFFLVGLGEARGQSAEVQKLLQEGDEAFDGKDYDKAAKRYDHAIAAEPRAVGAAYYARRAEIFAQQKQYEQGLKWMATIPQGQASNVIVLERKALLLFRAGREADAILLAESTVKEAPDIASLQLLIGDHYLKGGKDPGRAVVAYHAFLSNRPETLAASDKSIRVKLGYAEMYGGDYKKAEAELRHALGLSGSGDGEATLNKTAQRGLCAAIVGQKKWPEAETACAEALRGTATAEDASTIYNLGRALLMQKKDGPALEAANRYVALAPKAAAAYLLRADIYLQKADLVHAGADVARAEQIAPKDPGVARRRGQLALRRSPPDLKTATADLKIALAADPTDMEVALDLAGAYGQAGRPKEAVDLLRPVVEARPADPEVRVLIASSLLELGRAEDAIPELERALALGPSPELAARAKSKLADALNVSALHAISTGDPAAAENQLERAASLRQGRAAWKNLGLARVLLGHGADAVDPLERAAKSGNDAGVLQILARAYALSGRYHDAQKALEQALALAKGDLTRRSEISLDLAATLLDLGAPEQALDIVEPFVRNTGAAGVNETELGRKMRASYVAAARASADAWMIAGKFDRAYRLLETAEAAVPSTDERSLLALRCDLALAATVAGLHAVAEARLGALRGASCPFPPPADKLLVPILSAWAHSLDPDRAKAGLAELQQVDRRGLEPVHRQVVRAASLSAASRAYSRGQVQAMRSYLTSFLRDDRKDRCSDRESGCAEIELAKAVLAMEEGRLDKAIAAFKALSSTMPEALIHLGVAQERSDHPLDALEAFRRAARANPAFEPLSAWIETKERLWAHGRRTEVAP